MIAHYEDTKRNTFFSHLINLKQKGLIAEKIEYFQKLNIRVNDILEKKKIISFIYAMEADIDGMEAYWKKGMEDLKKDMEGLKEGGTKLLQERLPDDEKVVEETHDEKKNKC